MGDLAKLYNSTCPLFSAISPIFPAYFLDSDKKIRWQIPNSEASSDYLKLCKQVGVKSHPARFPAKLPEFFVKFLTNPGDLVVDIFAGSNTTGFVCESLDRKWLAFDMSHEYLAASAFRFHALISDPKTTYTELLKSPERDILLSLSFNA